MNDFGMDADSNSWGSDYGEDYGSDMSDGEYQPNGGGGAASSSAHQQHLQAVSRVKTKGGAQARKTVNRGRWTKDEVKKKKIFSPFQFFFYIVKHFGKTGRETQGSRGTHRRSVGNCRLLL